MTSRENAPEGRRLARGNELWRQPSPQVQQTIAHQALRLLFKPPQANPGCWCYGNHVTIERLLEGNHSNKVLHAGLRKGIGMERTLHRTPGCIYFWCISVGMHSGLLETVHGNFLELMYRYRIYTVQLTRRYPVYCRNHTYQKSHPPQSDPRGIIA